MPLELVKPEILRPDATVRVHARPHPAAETVYAEFRAGLSLAEILGPGARMCRVEVGGFTVPEKCWHMVRPKVGVAVVITRMPEGGSVKSIFRLIAFAALAIGVIAISGGAATPLLGGLGIGSFAAGTLSAGLLAAGVGLIGSLLINALIPPQAPSTDSTSSTDTLRSITGVQNQLDPYGAVPFVLGQCLAYPKLAARQFSELSGDDQYLRCLFDLGEGDPGISDMKIGDSDIATFTDVETEIGTNPSLFSQDVEENAITAELDTDGNTVTRSSATDADELSLDWVYAAGLFGLDGTTGNVVGVTQRVKVEYSPTGAGSWTTVTSSTSGLTISTDAATANGDGTFHVVNAARKAVRVGLRWKVANGQYDVRLTRVDTNWGTSSNDSKTGAMTWTVLRTIRYGAVSTTGTKKFAMRIKATDQLNGAISQFNCILSQPIPVWHADTSTWVTEDSRNPAFIFRYVMKDSPANPRKVSVDRLDDAEIKAWAQECADKGFVYSTNVDQPVTLFALLQDICAAGRASFNVRDGKYSVVRDLPQSTPVQVFTPRNSSGFSGTRAFPDAVHALRVQFTNPDANWQQDERVVYDDGYNQSNATNFEVLTLRGVTDPDAAWRLGRYHLAASRLRPTTYTWNTDIENLVCTRGDLVLFAHDVIEVGCAWGRVTDMLGNVAGDGSVTATSITLDEQMRPEVGKSYSMRVRRNDGTVAISSVTFAQYDSPSQTATLSSPIAGVNYGDLVTFGETGSDVLSLVVTRVDPAADFAAKITAVDAAPAVLNADSGTPPPWTSGITGQAQVEAPDPPSTVDVSSSQMLSPSDDGGITQPVMMVAVTGPWSGVSRTGAAILDHVEVRYRTSDPVGSWTTLALPRGELSVTISGVVRDVVYQIEARAVGTTGHASVWVAVTHTTANTTLPPNSTPSLWYTWINPNYAAAKIQLAWTPVLQPGVMYDVRTSDDNEVTWEYPVFLDAGPTSIDITLPSDLERHFQVRARTSAGAVSPWSNSVVVITARPFETT